MNNSDICSKEENASDNVFTGEEIDKFCEINMPSSEEQDPIRFIDEILKFPSIKGLFNNFIDEKFNISFCSEDSKPIIIPANGKNSKFKFQITCPKRGRPSFNKKRPRHGGTDFDNIQIKIQVHYFNFIVNLSNDALRAEFGDKTTYSFKKINHKFKKSIYSKYLNKLKTLPIKEILKMEISPKYKYCDKDCNASILNKVCNISPFLDRFFNIKYLEFFNNFYFKESECINKVFFEGKEIGLSKGTKPFYDLIQKYPKDKELLIKYAKGLYFNGYDSLIGYNSFKTLKFSDGSTESKE